jgi:aspartate aminotransferase
MALLDDGDEVIVPTPAWVSYPDLVALAGGRPVPCPTRAEDGYRLRAEDLERAITPRTRLLWINSPSNPTGAVYTAAELKALGEVLRKHPRIVIASDDMYEHILLDGSKFVNILNVCPELYGQTVTMNGVSKAYSMTGWRIGYCGGPQELIEAMENVQSHSTSNPTSISQYAAEAALTEEVIVVGYLITRFQQFRASQAGAIGLSALLRGSYHLYQGWGGFAGNVALGILFGLIFVRTRRTWPIVIAHFLLDVGAGAGYILFRDHLPGA